MPRRPKYKNLFPDKLLDHIDGNRDNNFDSNLRFVTKSQNGMNRSISSNNISGKSGVCWHTRFNKWEAFIRVNNKRIYLGRFDDFDKAVEVRIDAEDKYYGEYSVRISRGLQKDLFS